MVSSPLTATRNGGGLNLTDQRENRTIRPGTGHGLGILCRVIAAYMRSESSSQFVEIANDHKRAFTFRAYAITLAEGTGELVGARKAKFQHWFLLSHSWSLPSNGTGPLHGNRFRPTTFRIYVPQWRREGEKKTPTTPELAVPESMVRGLSRWRW